MMKRKSFLLITIISLLILNLLPFASDGQTSQSIPLKEHPRPDFQREQWLNLNGLWDFRFDPQNRGENEKWYDKSGSFDRKIMVPFPWGSKLSGVENEAEIGWYSRQIEIPSEWEGKKIFIVFGASDWITKVWLDGQLLGTFQGGYTPFEFEIGPYFKKGAKQQLVVRVDDSPFPYKLEGKQGYGQAKGIWQTVYLDARGQNFIKSIKFTPDIDKAKVSVKVTTSQNSSGNTSVKIKFLNGVQINPEVTGKVQKGSADINFEIPIEKMELWDLDNPFLYDVKAYVIEADKELDCIKSYFGMRKISVVNLPGAKYPYVALNNKPVYLRMCLDQSYNPDGFYTFPSDEFMKDEIIRSKRIGLNANRIHIKVEVPRKLYWADRLGLLIMADVPNFWGEPDAKAKKEYMVAMNGMLERDYNHPAIFQWVLFNETWGLFTEIGGSEKRRVYLPETQTWVENAYRQAKRLDQTRLIEDNSACNNDHVVTDVNSWHVYIPGYEWKKELDEVCSKCFPGSKWNFTGNRTQGNQPLINSECGNVWGYSGSTGDVDWSWDYHIMMNEFRSHPKIGGWLYTEHHDVINEWNGYYRYDRSEKYTGLEGIVPGMTINDLHSNIYISTGGPLCRQVKPSEKVEITLFASFMTDSDLGTTLTLKTSLYGWDQLGNFKVYSDNSQLMPYRPWSVNDLKPLGIQMPDKRGLAILSIVVEDGAGKVLHRNFTTFCIGEGSSERLETINEDGKTIRVVRFAPASYTSQSWSVNQWSILDGLKVDGAGSGYFEYEIPVPEDIKLTNTDEIVFMAELSAKQLFGKDRKDAKLPDGDYMLGKGTADPSMNPNSYPMTDTHKYPSIVRISVDGESIGTFYLEDDPADHRGILSWFSQPQNHKLSEAGSYGYMIKASVPKYLLQKMNGKTLRIRLEVDQSLPGGLAVYGEKFGRYPVDPSVIFVMKK
jgi:Glycosyl hydrolases family 2, sugar binding domain/Glycosyl hydrolases family 2/Glycosyl hydrolases family 2, TIM barrel domain